MIQIFKKEVQNLHIKPSTVIFNILFQFQFQFQKTLFIGNNIVHRHHHT